MGLEQLELKPAYEMQALQAASAPTVPQQQPYKVPA